ncbi:MAG: (Fe-S)-binding protein [Candidatus Altiarchaeota archaeon]
MSSHMDVPRKLLLFEGCTASRMLKPMRTSTYALLDKAVDKGVLDEYKTIPNERCCGYGSIGIGDEEGAEKCMEYNLSQMNRIGIKDVLFVCGACTAYLGQHEEFIKRGYNPINIMEYLYALIENGDLDKLVDEKLDSIVRITGHHSCHLRRTAEIKVEELYRTIVEYLGATYVEMSEPDTCCGAGSDGSTMTAIAEKKVLDAGRTGADLCPLACAGCEALMSQIGRQKGVKTRFISLSSLVVSCFRDLDMYLEKYEPVKVDEVKPDEKTGESKDER